jgi:Zn-dependent protease with chaperone function
VGSIFALGFLVFFLFAILFLTLFFTHLYITIGIVGIIVLVVIGSLIVWRVGPWINDHVFKWFYHLQWLSFADFSKMDSNTAKFVQKICDADKVPLPKIGYINDNNPQSFCYGSTSGNARLVFTNGIIKYLNTEERESVFAHEVGHIVHRDFIIMTAASTLLVLLYVIGRAFVKTRGRRNPLPLIGAVSLFFYFVGTYFLLYLSRVREYYADEYSRQKIGSGNPLSTALVKVAYGILSSQGSDKTNELMQGTRTLGIYDHKHVRSFGLAGADYLVDGDSDAIIGSMVFDTHNIWSLFLELSSSHPLTGKRIRHMLDGEPKPVFDISKVDNFPFDYGRNRKDFVVGFTISKLWLVLPILALIVLLSPAVLIYYIGGLISIMIIAAGLGLLIGAFYKYPGGQFAKATVGQLMSQVYATPVRGTPTQLDGQLVGRGVPGFVLSESMMLQDKTGLMYLNYSSGIPLIGDIYFAWKKVSKLLGNAASCTGWFFRGFSQSLSLYDLTVSGQTYHSREKILSVLGAVIVMIIGASLFALTFSAAVPSPQMETTTVGTVNSIAATFSTTVPLTTTTPTGPYKSFSVGTQLGYGAKGTYSSSGSTTSLNMNVWSRSDCPGCMVQVLIRTGSLRQFCDNVGSVGVYPGTVESFAVPNNNSIEVAIAAGSGCLDANQSIQVSYTHV